MISNVDERLLTVEDLAAKLQIAKQTIYNKVSAGEIPHVKIGGALRFRASDIDRWIASRSGAAA